jgi:hypothetical protein
VDPAAPVAAIASALDRSTAQHASPAVAAPAGAWVVQAWTDKSSSTTGWTAPAGATVRQTVLGEGGGRVTAVLTDSGGAVAGGQVGGQSATTSAASHGISWTVVLAPAP